MGYFIKYVDGKPVAYTEGFVPPKGFAEVSSEVFRDSFPLGLPALHPVQQPEPTPVEQLRADVDFLAAVQGVSL